MALPAPDTPRHKIDKLVVTINDHLDEIDGMQAVMCLRPECAPPTDTDAMRDTLVRLQAKLLNIVVKNSK